MHGMNIKVIHLCLYIGFIDVQYLLENDRNMSQLCQIVRKKYNFNISAFVGFICVNYPSTCTQYSCPLFHTTLIQDST